MALRSVFQQVDWVWRLLAAPEPDLAQALGRIRAVERDVGLPVKGAVLFIVGSFLYFSLNVESLANTSEVMLEGFQSLKQVYVAYALASAFFAVPIWVFRSIPLKVLQWVVFTAALLDAMFFAGLALLTDGFDSILFWVFPILVVRNALSMPVAPLQIALNLLVVLCYVAAGVLDLYIIQLDDQADVLRAAEPFLLRIFLLLLLGAICYGLQVLFDRDRERLAEAAEFSFRQGQMRTAGRLAAEVAHQIKNPLGIINNAAFSLQRSIPGSDESEIGRQLRIIREEVDRSDRILTELIGFAELAEGRIERLDVVEALESSIERVFPPGAPFGTRIEREFVPPLPVLMFSRRGLGEIFDNLLKNARDALQGGGTIRLRTWYGPGFMVVVEVRDDGPGIAQANLDRIFEAYFSTKSGGTGLGLAIVKQNVEMFGGRVEVESEVGQGTCFRLLFPGRTR
ncbi:MAG: nitrogen regulation protein NR(II) [Limisphaerales bacterium]